MPISGAKNEPSGHGKVLLLKSHKDQHMWKHFPCTLPNFEGCKRATFLTQGKQNLHSFLLTFPKVARLHSSFSLSICWYQKKRNWPLCYFIRSGLPATLSATISQIWARSPAPRKNGEGGLVGRGGLSVTLFVFMLGFNICSLVLMFFAREHLSEGFF